MAWSRGVFRLLDRFGIVSRRMKGFFIFIFCIPGVGCYVLDVHGGLFDICICGVWDFKMTFMTRYELI